MLGFKKLVALVSLLVLAGCIPSLGDTVKLEGGPGQGAGGTSCVSLADMLRIPPADPLKKKFIYPDGRVEYVGPVTYIIEFVRQQLDGATQEIFETLNEGDNPGDPGPIQVLITYSFALWIIIFSASVLLGLVRADPYDISMMIVKVTSISLLATNWGAFSTLIKDFVEAINEFLIAVVSGTIPYYENEGDIVTDFTFADDVVSTLLSFNMLKFIYVLFSPEVGTGWLYAVIVCVFIYFFVVGLLKAIYVFVVALIVKGVLYALAPLFLATIIFRKTKPFFDGWIKQLLNFTLMPVILFAFLGFFYSLIYVFIEELGSTTGPTPKPVCYGKGYSMPGNINEWFTLMFGVPGDKVEGAKAQIPIDLTPILILLILTYVFKNMTEWAISLSGALTQAFTSFSSAGAPAQLTRQLGNVARRRQGEVGQKPKKGDKRKSIS